MNFDIEEMEYAKKLWNHLHPSKLKEKIKVERPVYTHQKLKKKKIYVVFPKIFFVRPQPKDVVLFCCYY